MYWKSCEYSRSRNAISTAMTTVSAMTTIVEPRISFFDDQLTYFISPSVAIRKSTVLGFRPTRVYPTQPKTAKTTTTAIAWV